MPTYVRLTAAAAVVAILGLGAVSLIESVPGPGSSITTSSALPTAVPSMTSLSVRESARPLAGGLLVSGTFDSGTFGEPFIFTMPIPASDGLNKGLARQFDGARPDLSKGVIHFSGGWWTLRFVDDMPVLIDICDPTGGSMPDVPATPADARAWLEADQPMRMRSWVVAAPVEVPVDGRTALRWDLLESEEDLGCGRTWWGSDMLMRVYAIPTGDDTILLIGGSDMVNFTAVSTVMDEIVRSMDFR